MFKRIEKRRKKMEEEEELGLDEDTIGFFGIPETDSDESDSESSGEGEDAGDDKESGIPGTNQASELSGYEEDEEGDDSRAERLRPPKSVREALRDPLYSVSAQSPIKMCLICPRKLLKNSKMVAVHQASSAHVRRFKKFTEISSGDLDGNAWDYIPASNAMNFVPEKTSKRTEKRKAKIAAIKAKRDLQKVMKAKARVRKERKAMEAAKESEPVNKKRKPNPSKERRSSESPSSEPQTVPRGSLIHHTKSQSKLKKRVRDIKLRQGAGKRDAKKAHKSQ